jgi:hypothetical protein
MRSGQLVYLQGSALGSLGGGVVKEDQLRSVNGSAIKWKKEETTNKAEGI